MYGRGSASKPMHVIEKAHDGDVNSMEFHPTNEFLLASGGSDKVVKLWDMTKFEQVRNMLCFANHVLHYT